MSKTKYDLNKVAEELEETASFQVYHGNALYVAKDLPGLATKDKALLARWLTGEASADGIDSTALNDLAGRIRQQYNRAAADREGNVLEDLMRLISEHGISKDLNVTERVLADYLLGCLQNFERTLKMHRLCPQASQEMGTANGNDTTLTESQKNWLIKKMKEALEA